MKGVGDSGHGSWEAGSQVTPRRERNAQQTGLEEKLDEFGVPDNKLAQVAGWRGLVEFNPEDSG